MDGRRGMDSVTEGQEEDRDSAVGARERGFVDITSVIPVVATRLHGHRQPPTATACHLCHLSEPLQCHHSSTRANSVDTADYRQQPLRVALVATPQHSPTRPLQPRT